MQRAVLHFQRDLPSTERIPVLELQAACSHPASSTFLKALISSFSETSFMLVQEPVSLLSSAHIGGCWSLQPVEEDFFLH